MYYYIANRNEREGVIIDIKPTDENGYTSVTEALNQCMEKRDGFAHIEGPRIMARISLFSNEDCTRPRGESIAEIEKSTNFIHRMTVASGLLDIWVYQ